MSLPEPAAVDDTTHTEELSRAELTTPSQFDAAAFSPPLSPALSNYQVQDDRHLFDSLTFPRLESDGSLPDLRKAPASPRYYHTQPAALSSLGARLRMVGNMDLESSTDSLRTDYDMVEDASEFSTDDGHETASITSSDHVVSDDEGEITPEEAEEETPEGESDEVKYDFGSIGDLAGTLGVTKEQSVEEANRTMDSIMSDDLETPRQSYISPPTSPTETLLPTTSSATSAQSKDAPVRLEVIVYSDVKLTRYEASQLASRIATSIGARGSPKLVTLPPTPDDSEGTILCYYETIELTIKQADGLASPNSQAPDLIVVLVAKCKEDPLKFIEAVDEQIPSRVPMLVIARDEQQKESIPVVASTEMITDHWSFYGGYDESVKAELRSLLRNPLGLKSSGLSLPCFTKKVYAGMVKHNFWTSSNSYLLRLAIGALFLAVTIPALLSTYVLHPSVDVISIDTQRQNLATSLADWTKTTDVNLTKSANMLLPDNGLPDTFSMVVPPNQLLISMSVLADHVMRGRPIQGVMRSTFDISHNITRLASGVYGVTIPHDEAYGVINFFVPKPTRVEGKDVRGVVYAHNFGDRPCPPTKSYKEAGKDITKIINEDVAVARKAAKSLADRLGLELSSGAAATHNVTNQLAVRMRRDIQVFTSTAAGVLGEMLSAGTHSTEKISKELITARKDLIKRADDFKKSVATTARSVKDLIVPSKKALSSPLAVSRQRALSLKGAVAGKKAPVIDHVVPRKEEKGWRRGKKCCVSTKANERLAAAKQRFWG